MSSKCELLFIGDSMIHQLLEKEVTPQLTYNFLKISLRACLFARRVTRPGGTNKRSVYMKPSYSAFAA